MGGVGPGDEVGAHASPSGLLNELSRSICNLAPACLLWRGAAGKCMGAVCLGGGSGWGPGRVTQGWWGFGGWWGLGGWWVRSLG